MKCLHNKTKILTVTIKDCRIDTFRSGGKGGQNQNKRDTGVRVVHEASGARGEARDERTQLLNKRAAFRRMGESDMFQKWARLATAKLMGQETLDERVERQMQPQNLLVEVRATDGWVREPKEG